VRILVGTPDEAASAAADIIAAAVRDGATVLGVATGGSPQPLYRALEIRRAQGLDLSVLRAFALDEYVGLAITHPESYHSVIDRDVTTPLGLDPENVRVPPGDAENPDAAAAGYEQSIIEAGGIDLQILGIGGNGHIGFNEPGSPRRSRTRVVELAESTLRDNARYFDGEIDLVPTRAMTQGIATILDARRIVLVASGASKAEAVAAAVLGPATPDVPASYLQLHSDATIVLDHDAAALLPSSLTEPATTTAVVSQ
jgi:glucosamine-6-phosphate deaminase